MVWCTIVFSSYAKPKNLPDHVIVSLANLKKPFSEAVSVRMGMCKIRHGWYEDNSRMSRS